jgi:hypothetical protein
MADNKHNNADNSHEPQNAGIEYERRDVTISAVVKFVIVLAFGIGLSLLLMRGLFKIFDDRENSETVEPISQLEGLKKQLPAEPRIQGLPGFHDNPPATDMELYLKTEQLRLGTIVEKDEHGNDIPFQPVVTDPANNLVTIPIDRAMKAILEKGFKVDPNAPTSDQPNATRVTVNDEEIPAESSSGRTMQKLRRP